MPLSTEELIEARRELAAAGTANHDKAQANGAVQLVEDLIPGIKTDIAAAIEAAYPNLYNGPQKLVLGKTAFKRAIRGM